MAPELDKRCRPHLHATNDSWRVDETYMEVNGNWNYPQHIPIRYSEADVQTTIQPLQQRITQLEAHLLQSEQSAEKDNV